MNGHNGTEKSRKWQLAFTHQPPALLADVLERLGQVKVGGGLACVMTTTSCFVNHKLFSHHDHNQEQVGGRLDCVMIASSLFLDHKNQES